MSRIQDAAAITSRGIECIRNGEYPWSRLDKLIDRSATEIRLRCRDKNVAVAWSGGLDGGAALWVAQQVGEIPVMIGLCDLEYPCFMTWLSENSPKYLTRVNTGQDLEWLVEHPEMLFPSESKVSAKWFKGVQHTAQDRYFKINNLDMLITGRRRDDWNYVGKNGQNIYTTSKGITRYSPIAEWLVIDVFALAIREKLSWAPFSSMPRAFENGTHPWASRAWCGSIDNGWREIHSIDPSIVETAARKIPSAQQFMESI